MSLFMFWLATFDNSGSAHSVEERISFELDVPKTSQVQIIYVPPSLWTISTLRTDAGHVQHIASHMFKVPEPMLLSPDQTFETRLNVEVHSAWTFLKLHTQRTGVFTMFPPHH